MTSIISTFDMTVRDRINQCFIMGKLPDAQLYTLATQCNVSFTASTIRDHISQQDKAQGRKLVTVGYIHGKRGQLIPIE